MFALLAVPARILGCCHPAERLQGLGKVPLALALVTLLAGCGQKGPLFLPTPPVSPTPAFTRPAPPPASPASSPAATSSTPISASPTR